MAVMEAQSVDSAFWVCAGGTSLTPSLWCTLWERGLPSAPTLPVPHTHIDEQPGMRCVSPPDNEEQGRGRRETAASSALMHAAFQPRSSAAAAPYVRQAASNAVACRRRRRLGLIERAASPPPAPSAHTHAHRVPASLERRRRRRSASRVRSGPASDAVARSPLRRLERLVMRPVPRAQRRPRIRGSTSTRGSATAAPPRPQLPTQLRPAALPRRRSQLQSLRPRPRAAPPPPPPLICGPPPRSRLYRAQRFKPIARPLRPPQPSLPTHPRDRRRRTRTHPVVPPPGPPPRRPSRAFSLPRASRAAFAPPHPSRPARIPREVHDTPAATVRPRAYVDISTSSYPRTRCRCRRPSPRPADRVESPCVGADSYKHLCALVSRRPSHSFPARFRARVRSSAALRTSLPRALSAPRPQLCRPPPRPTPARPRVVRPSRPPSLVPSRAFDSARCLEVERLARAAPSPSALSAARPPLSTPLAASRHPRPQLLAPTSPVALGPCAVPSSSRRAMPAEPSGAAAQFSERGRTAPLQSVARAAPLACWVPTRGSDAVQRGSARAIRSLSSRAAAAAADRAEWSAAAGAGAGLVGIGPEERISHERGFRLGMRTGSEAARERVEAAQKNEARAAVPVGRGQTQDWGEESKAGARELKTWAYALAISSGACSSGASGGFARAVGGMSRAAESLVSK
ncbi:hypothetical protein B0H15DRAFT_970524 [Mycena belliarum]|uniref:Uncharacterized protein n=1 Tax=Mycena belliarum TaxID=1033014 RepID=A0AAD6TQS3_9AGAR|nr:hypothetical protein B0H15DRAFT_970524 [Mycena belliae]